MLDDSCFNFKLATKPQNMSLNTDPKGGGREPIPERCLQMSISTLCLEYVQACIHVKQVAYSFQGILPKDLYETLFSSEVC